MSATRFVRGSSIVIAAWLVTTFLSDVPVKGYPKLDRRPSTASLELPKAPLTSAAPLQDGRTLVR